MSGMLSTQSGCPSTASQPGDSSLSVLAVHNGDWPEGPMAALGVACRQWADLTWHMGKSSRPELRAPQDGAGEQVRGGLSPISGVGLPRSQVPMIPAPSTTTPGQTMCKDGHSPGQAPESGLAASSLLLPLARLQQVPHRQLCFLLFACSLVDKHVDALI